MTGPCHLHVDVNRCNIAYFYVLILISLVCNCAQLYRIVTTVHCTHGDPSAKSSHEKYGKYSGG